MVETRDELRLDEWARDRGPSNDLRRWFGHDPARWDEFHDRFAEELQRDPKLDELAERARHGRLTIVCGARDETHNQARLMAEELERRLTRTDKRSTRR